MASDGLSEQLVDSLNAAYGVHPGCRAAHAKGVLCAATFTPSAEAPALSRAAHLAGGPVRAHVRFSNGGGNPTVADSVRDGRGVGVKLYTADGTTDIVGLSLPVFFTRTPEDLLEFNAARRPDPATGAPDLDKVGAFLAAHPETVPAVTAAITHPIPLSYATITYNSIHAYGFVAADGTERHGRYRLVPLAGEESVSDDDAATLAPDYLRDELAVRFASGPARFAVDVRIAAAEDPVDDPTAAWPEDRPAVRIGELAVTGFASDRERDGDILVFDPTRVVDGIELTKDPILLARRGAYSVSVARRAAR